MDQSLPARVIDTLLPALRAGLINELGPGQFIFSHTLVRDAIDDALGGEERAALHGRADAALAALGDTSDILVERARHALSALRLGDEPHALSLAKRATELLEREGAFDRAFELHARIGAAQATGLLPPALATEKLHVAEIARAAGRSDVCRRLCEEVVISARSSGDSPLLARAALLHAADVRPGVIDRSQIAWLEEARAALGEDWPELGCVVLARLSAALQPAPHSTLPMEMARDAIQKARATNDPETLLQVLDVAAWGLYYAALPERTEGAAELLERALAANDLPRALIAYEWLAFHHLEAGDFEAFHRDAEKMLELADEIGHPRYRWRALLIASARAVTLGHFAESDRYVTEVTELATLTDDPALPLALAIHRVKRARMQRRDDELQVTLALARQAMQDVSQPAIMGALLRATCAARMDDFETARAEIAFMGAGASALDGHPTSAAMLAEAYALAGTDDERRRIRAALERAPSPEITGGHLSFMYEGTVARVLGLLDASLGDLASAEQKLRHAHTLAVARKHAPWIAQTAHELAKIARQAGRQDDARPWLEECTRIARQLGMTGLEGSTGANVEAVSPAPRRATRMQRTESGWSVVRGTLVVSVKDSRGTQLLARLVSQPDEEIHVLALASDEATTRVPESSAGEMLDEKARRTYRARLADLEQDIAEAESQANVARAATLVREREALVAELARAVGLGRRGHRAGSATERARVNVQRRVKDAVARITEVDEELGRFFADTVRTGTFCCFRPT